MPPPDKAFSPQRSNAPFCTRLALATHASALVAGVSVIYLRSSKRLGMLRLMPPSLNPNNAEPTGASQVTRQGARPAASQRVQPSTERTQPRARVLPPPQRAIVPVGVLSSPPAAAVQPKPNAKNSWGWVVWLMAVVVGINLCATVAFGFSTFFPKSNTSPIVAVATRIPTFAIAAEWEVTPVALSPVVPATPVPVFPAPQGVRYLLLLGLDARQDQLQQPTRTDSVMVARVDFDKKNVRLLSFPRDLWVAMPSQLAQLGYNEARINEAYFYAEFFDTAGGGAKAAMDTVTLNFGIPLDGYILLNFYGFVDVVDALGGVDIDVPSDVYDPAFPTDDYGYMEFYVPAGRHHMDGITALRYARTRHQDNDNKRAERQQAVMIAMRDASLDFDIIQRLPALWLAFANNFKTDLTIDQTIEYGIAVQGINRSNIQTYNLDYSMLQDYITDSGAAVYLPNRELLSPLIQSFISP